VKIRRGHVYVVDFRPRLRTKPGKIRPAIVVQHDALNDAGYPSSVVLPLTSRIVDSTAPLRLRVDAGTAGLDRDSDVLIGQVIAVANESFLRELGVLPDELVTALDEKLRWVLRL
jgi:mRNA interferase MazF